MRIAQVQSAAPAQPKASALPFQIEPLALDAEARTRLLNVLSGSPDLSKLNGAVEKAPPAASTPTRVQLGNPEWASWMPGRFLGLPYGAMWGWRQDGPYRWPSAGYGGVPYADWRKALDHTKPLLLPRESIDAGAANSVAAPTALSSMGFVKPPVGVNATGAVQLMPGLFMRPLPASRAKLERIGQVATWGQIAVEPFGEAGIHSPVLEGAGAVFDVAAAGVAVAELVQYVANPKPMPRWKKFTFFLKRGLAIITGASHFVGVGTEYMRVVGIVVKICDRGADQYYTYKIEPPEQPPAKPPLGPPRGPARRA